MTSASPEWEILCSCTTVNKTWLHTNLSIEPLPIKAIFLRKPYFSSVNNRKLWSNQWNTSWMYLTIKNLSAFLILAISAASDICLQLSPICLFLTYAVYCKNIKSGWICFEFPWKSFWYLWVPSFVWISDLCFFFY